MTANPYPNPHRSSPSASGFAGGFLKSKGFHAYRILEGARSALLTRQLTPRLPRFPRFPRLISFANSLLYVPKYGLSVCV
jgi:hypothetical protein